MAGTGDLLALVTGRIQRRSMVLDDIAELVIVLELVDAVHRAGKKLDSWDHADSAEEAFMLHRDLVDRVNEAQQAHYERVRLEHLQKCHERGAEIERQIARLTLKADEVTP